MISLGLGIVFSAGVTAAFNPCGIALLPSYVAYLMGGQERNWLQGIKAGIMMTLGFLSVFLPLGLLTALFKGFFENYLSFIVVFVGFFLIITGWFMYSGKEIFTVKTFKIRKGRSQAWSFYLYGIAYALTSLGCTLPIFSLMVVTALTSGSFLDGLVKFLAYGIGMGIVVTLISIAAVISRQVVQSFINNVAPVMNQFSAILMMGSGIFLIVKWWPF